MRVLRDALVPSGAVPEDAKKVKVVGSSMPSAFIGKSGGGRQGSVESDLIHSNQSMVLALPPGLPLPQSTRHPSVLQTTVHV